MGPTGRARRRSPPVSEQHPQSFNPEDFVRLSVSFLVGIGDSFNERMAIVRKPRPREQRSDAARNHKALLRAATAAVHREGPRVSMATIAADAGVGIGTLYRHFPNREDLLNSLTRRSFEQVLSNAQDAETDGTTPSETNSYGRCTAGRRLQCRKPSRCATRSTTPCNGSSNVAVPTARLART